MMSTSTPATKKTKATKKSYYEEENALEQLERYRLLVENIEDYAIFLLDTEGNIASWNLGAEKFKGYKPHEIIGQHFSVFYSAEDKKNDKPGRELREAISHGRVEDEGWRIRKDGTRFWANVVITALYDKQGRHRGFAKVTRDLTERKEYEDTLYAANVKLDVSYRELQKLNAAKDEFVSLASHQLRTPATGVKQYIALLLEGYMGPLTEQQRDCLQKAYDSNNRQIEIVNDLLHVAQLDAGKVILKKSPTDIARLIEDIIDEQVDTFKARRQKVQLKLPPEAPTVNVDAVRFRMVLENLIDNAGKYTPELGEITVSVTSTKEYTKIMVADTGIGIAEKDIPTLFEKFTRVSSPLTQHISGSGLGLYWVNKVVALHGGRIEVASVPNEGTVFSIIIPTTKTGKTHV